MLVPYTWNGTSDSTYNYLTQGALTTTGTMPGVAKIKEWDVLPKTVTYREAFRLMFSSTQHVLHKDRATSIVATAYIANLRGRGFQYPHF